MSPRKKYELAYRLARLAYYSVGGESYHVSGITLALMIARLADEDLLLTAIHQVNDFCYSFESEASFQRSGGVYRQRVNCHLPVSTKDLRNRFSSYETVRKKSTSK